MKEILDYPRIYEAAQVLITLGGPLIVSRRIRGLLSMVPQEESLLDVGCGPKSYLFRMGLRPVGVDLSPTYICKYMRVAETGVAASADALPFASSSFGAVWATNLFHHLPAPAASQAAREFIRVCRKPGYVAIMDWVSPRSKWKRPLAPVIQSLDRGQFTRSQEDLEALLPDRDRWSIRRFTYSLIGLEMLMCWYFK